MTQTNYFEQYLKLLLQLSDLNKQSKSDTKEYDDVLDQMDFPWYQLSEGEMLVIEWVSETLFNDEISREHLEELVNYMEGFDEFYGRISKK